MLAVDSVFPLIARTAVWVYACCAVLLSLYGIHRYAILFRWWRSRRTALPEPEPPVEWPRVTVQLPVFNERYVVNRLLAAACALDYPRDRLEIQVLDDSTDDTVAIVADAVQRHRNEGHNIVHIHRDQATGFKAGALAAGLETATGEYVAVFDADFVPSPDLLRRTVPHFSDSAVGMVQVRWGHLNDEYSLLTRIQRLLLDGHFLLEHTARHRSGHFFNFNGTAGVWRREAIIEGGGWQHDTLTEDLDLSYRAQLAGWRFVYLPDVVAPAELPVDINGFKSQQHRWAKGSVQTARKLLGAVWSSKVPLGTKVEATVHLTGNLCYPLLLCLATLAFPTVWVRHVEGWSRVWMWLDVAVVLSAVASIGAFYTCTLIAAGERGYRACTQVPLLMAAGIGLAVNNSIAAIEALAGHASPFRRTPKYGIRRRRDAWAEKRYRVPLPRGAYLEALFAVYTLVAVQYVVREHLWHSLPFLVLFATGFGYVAWTSFQHRFGRRHARLSLEIPRHLLPVAKAKGVS